MATPRKAWFRVADSIGDEAWTNDQIACLIRLMAAMNTRWARHGLSAEEACTIELNKRQVLVVSGRGRADVGLRLLVSLADLASISVQSDGEIVRIKWPKFAEFQRLDSLNRGNPGVEKKRTPPPPPITTTCGGSNYVADRPKEAPRDKLDRPPKPPPPPWADEASKILGRLVSEHAPGARVPKRLDQWARDIARIDAPPDHIIRTIEWLFGPNIDSEYAFVVQSGRALREKFGRVSAAMRAASAAPAKGHLARVKSAMQRVLEENHDV